MFPVTGVVILATISVPQRPLAIVQEGQKMANANTVRMGGQLKARSRRWESCGFESLAVVFFFEMSFLFYLLNKLVTQFLSISFIRVVQRGYEPDF